jgi:hypothetical protein
LPGIVVLAGVVGGAGLSAAEREAGRRLDRRRRRIRAALGIRAAEGGRQDAVPQGLDDAQPTMNWQRRQLSKSWGYVDHAGILRLERGT